VVWPDAELKHEAIFLSANHEDPLAAAMAL
jgi:hypothetical protein